MAAVAQARANGKASEGFRLNKSTIVYTINQIGQEGQGRTTLANNTNF